MPLKNYNGPSNSPDLLPHLQNETIKGAYFDAEGALCIVVSDGSALVLSSTLAGGNHGGAPTYHKRLPYEVAREVVQLAMAAERAAAAAKHLADLASAQAENAEHAKSAYGIEKEEVRDLGWWKRQAGARVRVAPAPIARSESRPGAIGLVLGAMKEAHGVSVHVEHEDRSHAWYDADELTVLS
jgi:hypothetical protein